jgi:hypothetical protein
MTIVTDPITPVSLIPYLNPGTSRFYLSLASGQPNLYTPSPSGASFFPVLACGPYTKLSPAALLNDFGQTVVPLYLLIQKDICEDSGPEAPGLTNEMLEKRWQTIFSACSQPDQEGAPPILLKDQREAEDGLRPFHPLFYCSLLSVFFQPFCPFCGGPLHLCRDDRLLTAHELSPYETTCKRYLYCEDCLNSGCSTEFYAVEKTPADPEHLVDAAGLIRQMGRLKVGPERQKPPYPCPDCKGRKTCFGRENLALNRVSVFSFYPFYMIIYNADKVSAAHYEDLASGAVLTEPKTRQSASTPGIGEILKRIRSRWQTEIQVPAMGGGRETDRPHTGGTAAPPALEPTRIILKSNSIGENAAAPADKQLDKTRLISGSEGKGAPAGRPPAADQGAEGEPKPEPSGNGSEEQVEKVSPEREDDLKETVLLSSRGAGGRERK